MSNTEQKKILFGSTEEKQRYLDESYENARWIKLKTPVPCTSQDCLNAAYAASIDYNPVEMSWGFIATCKDCVIRLAQIYDVKNAGTVDATRTDIGPVDN